jgi:CubicO group peptidase (beta-lactamase class C family)
MVFAGALGYRRSSPAVDDHTWYDLASLTKSLATATAALRMTYRQKLDPDRLLSDFFPGIRVSRARVRHLLSHSSGLSAYVPFFKSCATGEDVIRRIISIEAEYPTGTKSVYSDLGFMLLGRVLEMVAGLPFRDLIQSEVLEPLGDASIQFGPLPKTGALKIAPTELDFGLHDFATGTVHDENARLFGGSAGHAGLFATLPTVAQFAERLLRIARGQADPFLPGDLFKTWTRRQPWLPNSSWGLGWDTPTPESSAGPALSQNSFGHTGFTGTSLWIDPDRDIYICILSNRVHPSRRTEGIKDARRRIHELAVGELRQPPIYTN